MSDCKSEQRVNIKFLVKLKKSATENFQLLTPGEGAALGSVRLVGVVSASHCGGGNDR
jgi:hypothetical protein